MKGSSMPFKNTFFLLLLSFKLNLNFIYDIRRTPQRRRPGAIYRDHEIFRNAIRTVRQYIGPSELNGSKGKPCVLKRTRSGLIYGSFSDTEDN